MVYGDPESGGTNSYPRRFYSSMRLILAIFVITNIAVFLAAMYLNDCPINHPWFLGDCVAKFLGRFSFEPLKQNPLLGPSSSTLKRMGALTFIMRHDQELWRLLSSIWLHAGVIHLLVNMGSLIVIMIRLEQRFGFDRIGIIYLLSGFSGAIFSSAFMDDSISVGASGPLFGLLGAMLSELVTNWSISTNKAATMFTLLGFIAINSAIGILPHCNNFVNIGGFLTGFFLGFALFLPTQSKRDVGLLLVAWAFMAVVFTVIPMLLRMSKSEDVYGGCCRYLRCVPTSLWECK